MWLGARNGFLYSLDRSTGEIVLENQVAIEIADIAVSEDAVWVADNGAGISADRPLIRRLNPVDLTEQASIPVGTVADAYEDLLLEPETLWVLVGNSFASHRIDLTTNIELSSLPLSQNPRDPGGQESKVSTNLEPWPAIASGMRKTTS